LSNGEWIDDLMERDADSFEERLADEENRREAEEDQGDTGMNYYAARQVDPKADRPDAGKWRYTSMRDGSIWPVGACAEGCVGHDTAEQAYEHQRQWLLSQLRVGEAARSVSRYAPGKCCCCDAVATHEAYIAGEPVGYTFRVCDEHNNRESLEPLIDVGESMSSY